MSSALLGSENTVNGVPIAYIHNSSKYKNYVSQVDKALKAFECTNEWPDLISALSKLAKVFSSNAKFNDIPKPVTVAKRLSQCLHPALPSGVHLKALETYRILFEILGEKCLPKLLYLFTVGLFPLMDHCGIKVKCELLKLFENYFLPLGEDLRPALPGFITAVLLGLEEGTEFYDRSFNLLEQVLRSVGGEAFYASLWQAVLGSPLVRLPALVFVNAKYDKILGIGEQQEIMGGDHADHMIAALCAAADDDGSTLVQRNLLDFLCSAFPLNSQHLSEPDLVQLLRRCLFVVLRRDMSLNRRLFQWLLNRSGDSGGTSIPVNGSENEVDLQFFKEYSLPLIKQALIEYLKLDTVEVVTHSNIFGAVGGSWDNTKELQLQYTEVRVCRLLLYFLDRPELGNLILKDALELFLNFVSKLDLSTVNEFTQRCRSIHPLNFISPWKEDIDEFESNKEINDEEEINDSTKRLNRIELIGKTMNMLLDALDVGYVWEYLQGMFERVVEFECGYKCTTINRESLRIEQITKKRQYAKRMNENLRLFPLIVKFSINHVHLNTNVDVRGIHLPNLLKKILLVLNRNKNFENLSKNVLLSIIVLCRDLLKEINQCPSVTEPNEQGRIEECLIEYKSLIYNISTWYVNNGRGQDKYGVLLASGLLLRDFCDFPLYSLDNKSICETTTSKPFSDWLNGLLKIVDINSWNNNNDVLGKNSDIDVRCQMIELIIYIYAKSVAVLEQHKAVRGRERLNCYREYVGGLYGQGEEKSSITVLLKPFLDCEELLNFSDTLFFQQMADTVWNEMDDDVGLSRYHQFCSKLLLLLHSVKVNEPSSEAENAIVNDLTNRNIAKSIKAAKKFRNLWTLNRSIDTEEIAPGIPVKQFNRVYLVLLGVLADESLTNGGTQLKNIVISWLMDCAKKRDLTRVLQMLIKMLLNPATSRISIHYVHISSRISSDQIPGMPSDVNVVNLKTTTAGQEIHHICKVPSHKQQENDNKEDNFIDIHSKTNSKWVNEAKKRLIMPFESSYTVSNFIKSTSPKINNENEKYNAEKSLQQLKVRHNRALSDIPHFDDDDDIESLDNISVDSVDHDVYDAIQAILDKVCDSPLVKIGIPECEENEIRDLFKEGLKKSEEKKENEIPLQIQGKGNSSTLENSSKLMMFSSTPLNSNNTRKEHSILTHQKSLNSGSKHSSIGRKGHRRQDSLQQKIFDMHTQEMKNFNPTEMPTLTAAGDDKQQLFDEQHSHMLLYSQSGKKVDLGRVERVFTILTELLKSDKGSTMLGRHIVMCMISDGTNSINPENGGTISQMLDLFLRHNRVVQGHEFWSSIQMEEIPLGKDKDHISGGFDATKKKEYTFLELFITIALYYLRSYFLNSPVMEVTQQDLLDSWRCKKAALEFLTELCKELILLVRDHKLKALAEYVQSSFLKCKLPRCVILFLLSSVRSPEVTLQNDDIKGKPTAVFSADVLDFNDGPIKSDEFPYAIQAYNDALLDFSVVYINLEYDLRTGIKEFNDDNINNLLQTNNTFSLSNIQCSTPIGRSYTHNDPYSCVTYLKVFLCILLKSLQRNPERHERWLQFIMNTLPFLDVVLKPYSVHLVDQLCSNLRIAIGRAYIFPSNNDNQESLSQNLNDSVFSTDDNCSIDITSPSTTSFTLTDERLKYISNNTQHEYNKSYPPSYCIMILEALTSIIHYCVVDNSQISEGHQSANVSTSSTHQNTGGGIYGMVGSAISAVPGSASNTVGFTQIENRVNNDNWRDTREEMLKILPHTLSTIIDVWNFIRQSIEKATFVKGEDNKKINFEIFLKPTSDLMEGYPLEPTLPLGTPHEIAKCIIKFLTPIAQSNQIAFLNAMAFVWSHKSETTLEGRIMSRNEGDRTSFIYSSDQLDLVNLLLNIKALPLDYIINIITDNLKDTGVRNSKQLPSTLQTTDKTYYGICIEVNLLELLHGCIKQLSIESREYKNLWNSLYPLFNEVPINNLPPRGIFLLFIIFSDYVRGYGSANIIEDKSISSSMQSCCQRLTEGLNNIVGWQLESTTWLKRTLVVKQETAISGQGKVIDHSPSIDYRMTTSTISDAAVSIRASTTSLTTAKLSTLEGPFDSKTTQLNQANSTSSSQLSFNPSLTSTEKTKISSNFRSSLKDTSINKRDPINSTQALFLLAENLAELIDSICKSDDKEKLLQTLQTVWSNTLPFLRAKSARNSNFFLASSQFLASISSFNYMRSVWKKTTLDLLMDPNFFKMDVRALKQWLIIIDNLMTHDKTSFNNLLSRISTSQNSALSSFISSKEQEYELRAQALKRLAFVVLSSGMDQYAVNLPDIQERLSDNLKISQVPTIHAQVFTCYRVLLIRLKPTNFASMWPSMITELVQVLLQIENQLSDLNSSMSDDLKCSKDEQWMQLYLSACKLLETLCTLPSGYISQFQMCHWAFVSSVGRSANDLFIPFATRINNLLSEKYGKLSEKDRKELSASLREVKTLFNFGDLRPFFSALVDQHKTVAAGITGNQHEGQLREASCMNGTYSCKNSISRLESAFVMLNKSDWVSFFPKPTGGLSRNYSLWDIMTLDQNDMTQFHHMWLGIFIWTTIILTIVYALAFFISFINLRHHSWVVFSFLPFLLLLIIPQFLLNLMTCAIIAFTFSAGGKAITAWHCLGIGCVQSLFSIIFSYTRILQTL
ncbi:Protein dopey-1 [Strongyloides ratti]|uniref:Protein dopey-1 n=1 Tax=Strongyloides ratti TaxID=34506 RepID=A0A090L965_STRRB|nr:Protein dopey-1 [Strongyloides ratti]CEF66277.1 Protein dopey-1 [Strongyloides ratti]